MAHGDITHVEFPVSSFAAASELYARLFGWEISAPPGFEDYPMFQAPNGVSGGALTPRDEASGQPLAYVEVDSIDAVLAEAEASGATVIRPRSEITETSWWAVLEDPDGNRLGLFEGTM